MKTVNDILDEAGVPRLTKKIADMAEAGLIPPRMTAGGPVVRKPDVSTVYKWRKSGIPEVYWPAVRELTDATTEEIHQANLRLHSDTGGLRMAV